MMGSEARSQVAFISRCFPPETLPLRTSTVWSSRDWEWNGVLLRANRSEGLGCGKEEFPSGEIHARSHLRSDAASGKRKKDPYEEDDENDLTLKLWGSSSGDENSSSKVNKRHRSGQVNASRPVCQVDGCLTDLTLTGVKDYHRKHKVCELHSKASTAKVGNVMQRFCQQCSRFHPLQLFDEGKRSCRRRLAGHNERRRKTQTEDVCKMNSHAGDNNILGNLDVAGFVSALSQQLLPNNGRFSGQLVLDNQHIFNSLMKLKRSSTATDESNPSLDLNVPQPQSSAQRQDDEASVMQSLGSPDTTLDAARILTALTREHRSSSRSPSSSPPIMHELFPTHSSEEGKLNSSISVSEDEITPERSPEDDNKNHPKKMHRPARRAPELRICSYTSSGSEHSPSSSSSDALERTNKIVVKLFDKDPSDFPDTLRTQILEWLSHCPSEMEGYIRPGCVILTIFASMSAIAWEQLRRTMLERMKMLLTGPCHDFWKNGRFLVHAEKQIVLVKDGKVRFCKSYTSSDAPEIRSVCPVAVVAGEETKITLQGRNLTNPGTKFLFAYRGEFISQKAIPEHCFDGSTSSLNSTCIEHVLSLSTSNVLGRLFIEVERGFKGNSFPVIVADNAICTELRTLETNFDVAAKEERCRSDFLLEGTKQASIYEETVDFLNELGWLFQRVSFFGVEAPLPEVTAARFKFLLTYSVERDWMHLLKKILDILFFMKDGKNITGELDFLYEVQLLHRAVKRNCRRVVDLLLSYVPSSNSIKGPLFRPDATGPGGLTPLHIAAAMQKAEDIVDALTSDPQKIGLDAWTKVLDENQQTPQLYASMTNNHAYNKIVQDKLSNEANSQVSITISNEASPFTHSHPERPNPALHVESLSCAQCSRLRLKKVSKFNGFYGSMYRPFVHSVLSVATVCATVCLLFKGFITVGPGVRFKWENVAFGSY